MINNKQKLQDIISQGEGLTIEFKKAKNRLPNNLFETVCAFLNKTGGEIILGVDDDKTIVGVDDKVVEQLAKEIANMSNNPQKLFPSFLLQPHIIEIEEKKLIYIFVPISSQVHNTANKIYDRSADGDFVLNSDSQIRQVYTRKSNEYSENRIYPYLYESDFSEGVVARVRRIIRIYRPNHPWNELSNLDFYKTAGLYRKDLASNLEGFTMAALLLFGKPETISSAIPHYKVDALLRIEDLDRYDDRINIRCNIIESYDKLMAFVEKHLPDKFHLQGDQRISLREKIFREVIANILIHREYTNAFPTSFIIYKDKVVSKNANKPHHWGELKPGDFEPFPKNPHIAQIFTQMGRSEELGTGVRNVFRYNKIYSGTDNNTFVEDDVFITTVTLKVLKNSNDGLNDGLNDRQLNTLKKIKEMPGVKVKELSYLLGIPIDTLDRYIHIFVNKNLVERRGSKRTGGYYTK